MPDLLQSLETLGNKACRTGSRGVVREPRVTPPADACIEHTCYSGSAEPPRAKLRQRWVWGPLPAQGADVDPMIVTELVRSWDDVTRRAACRRLAPQVRGKDIE